MKDNMEVILTYYYNKDEGDTISMTTDSVERPNKRVDNLRLRNQQYRIYSDVEKTIPLGHMTAHGSITTLTNIYTASETGFLTFDKTDDHILFSSGVSAKGGGGFYNPNTTVVCRIIGGNGIYTFIEGYVVINTFERGERVGYVYARK